MISKNISFLFILFLIITTANQIKSQDLLYFCEKYTDREIGVSDRFTTGALTVMVKLNKPIYYNNVSIQLDKYSCLTDDFEYYDSRNFDVDGKWSYIHFDKIAFSDAGLFRVFLLDPEGNTIVSGLIEIVKR